MYISFASSLSFSFFFFFFNDTATTEIYTLSLHDALPISRHVRGARPAEAQAQRDGRDPVHRKPAVGHGGDRKSTRLNSSHLVISYAVFCLKKKKKKNCINSTVPCPDGNPTDSNMVVVQTN